MSQGHRHSAVNRNAWLEKLSFVKETFLQIDIDRGPTRSGNEIDNDIGNVCAIAFGSYERENEGRRRKEKRGGCEK